MAYAMHMHSMHVHKCVYVCGKNASFTIVATIAFAARNALLILVCMLVPIPVEAFMNSEIESVSINIHSGSIVARKTKSPPKTNDLSGALRQRCPVIFKFDKFKTHI